MPETSEDRENIAYGESEEWETVHKEGYGERRWTEAMLTVVKHRKTGELRGIPWERGLTEMQEDTFYRPSFKVEAYEETIPAKTVTKYREAKGPPRG